MSNIFKPTEIFVPKYMKLQEIFEEHERAHWDISEIDCRVDAEQFKNGKISDTDKAYIKNILRLFTQADTDVSSSYVNRLLPVFKNADARMMLLSFANRESIHMKGYKILNDTLGYDSEAFMSEFLSFSEMKKKHEFMIEEEDLSNESGIASYLAKQVLMEGVNLFASFAMLLSLSQRGLTPGMTAVNQWSIADESLHAKGLSELFKIVLEENPKVVNNQFKAGIYETARTVVKLEDDFIDLCYKAGTNSSVTPQELKDYIRYVCDYRMQQLGLKPQFGIKSNPIEWMDLITSNTFANFFEATSVQYSKGSLVGDWVY